MLTNKNRFVKGIALVMAVLMVLAVCLTGCTDADAQAAAEKAQETADAAKTTAEAAKTEAAAKTTTEAVADQITAALTGYLTKDSALTEDDVKKLVDASLTDYAKKSDINLDGYAKAADLTALSNALKGYVTSEQFTKLKTDLENALKTKVSADDVDKKLATYATQAYVQKALESAPSGGLTLTQVQDEIKKALKDYYKKSDVDAEIDKLEDLVASYFNDADAATVAKAMGWLLEAYADNKDFMSLEKWNEVTDKVIETINYLQDLYKKIESPKSEGYGYLASRIAEINTIMGNAFDLGTVKFYDMVTGTDANNATVKKLLEYRILRCATMEEINALKNAAYKALQVHNFNDDWADLMNEIDSAALITEFDVAYKIGSTAKKTNVSTIYNKEAFNTYNEKMDDLLVEYNTDSAKPVVGSRFEMQVYKIVNVETKSGAAWSAPVARVYNNAAALTNGDTVRYTELEKTVALAYGTQNDVAYVDVDDLMPSSKNARYVYNLLRMKNKNDEYIIFDYDTEKAETTKYGTIETVSINTGSVNPDSKQVSFEKKYNTIAVQIANAQIAINEADDAFYNFLKNDLKFPVTTKVAPAVITELDRDTYKGKGDKADVAGAIKLLRDEICGYLDDVAVKKNAATLINGDNGADGKTYPAAGTWLNYTYFDNYYLYRSLLAAAFERQFTIYRDYANDLLLKMQYDYQSILLQAVDATYDQGANEFTLTKDYSALSAALKVKNISGGAAGDEILFSTVYFNGGAFQWVYESTIPSLNNITAPKSTFKGLKGLYTTEAVNAAIANINANAILINTELGAAIVSHTNSILNFNVEEAKNSGKTPKDAFLPILQDAVVDLNDVMYRYYVEAMKIACRDALYAKAEIFVERYVAANLGVEAVTLGQYENILEAAQAYVDTKNYWEAHPWVPTATQTVRPDPSNALNDQFSFGYDVVKALLYNTSEDSVLVVEEIVKTDIPTSGINESNDVGTDAMEEIIKIYNDAVVALENFVIRCCIKDYIKEAKQELIVAQQSWISAVATNIAKRAELTYAVTNAYINSLNEITVVEYQLSKGAFKLEDSKATYAKLLGIICDRNNSAVIDVVIGNTGDKTATTVLNAAVKCYAHVNDWFKKVAATGVTPYDYIPVDPFNFNDTVIEKDDLFNTYLGSAVVAMDTAVNPQLYK